MIATSLLGEVLPEDKKLHAMAGTAIYVSCLFVAGIAYNNSVEWLNAKTCLVPVYVAGVSKEIYDHHNGGTAEYADFATTVSIPTTGFIVYQW